MGHSGEGELLLGRAVSGREGWVGGRRIDRKTTVSVSGSHWVRPPPDDTPTESVTFVYGKLTISYVPQDPTSAPVVSCYDATLQAAC
jgi:hypothetical protein